MKSSDSHSTANPLTREAIEYAITNASINTKKIDKKFVITMEFKLQTPSEKNVAKEAKKKFEGALLENSTEIKSKSREGEDFQDMYPGYFIEKVEKTQNSNPLLKITMSDEVVIKRFQNLLIEIQMQKSSITTPKANETIFQQESLQPDDTHVNIAKKNLKKDASSKRNAVTYAVEDLAKLFSKPKSTSNKRNAVTYAVEDLAKLFPKLQSASELNPQSAQKNSAFKVGIFPKNDKISKKPIMGSMKTTKIKNEDLPKSPKEFVKSSPFVEEKTFKKDEVLGKNLTKINKYPLKAPGYSR